MRKQGLVFEVMDQKDVEVIGKCELDKIGFLVERPKKVDPTIITYDVERDYREEELREQLFGSFSSIIPFAKTHCSNTFPRISLSLLRSPLLLNHKWDTAFASISMMTLWLSIIRNTLSMYARHGFKL